MDGSGAWSTRRKNQTRRSMQKYTARIHVGDAARIILAGLRHREVVNRETSLVTLYNCVDDSPEGRTSVDLFAASILSAPEGTTEELLREFDQSRFTNTGLEEKRGGPDSASRWQPLPVQLNISRPLSIVGYQRIGTSTHSCANLVDDTSHPPVDLGGAWPGRDGVSTSTRTNLNSADYLER
eukprot:scaffold2157_cov376-Prasinococcus_capsulatus_cf.AAC.9